MTDPKTTGLEKDIKGVLDVHDIFPHRGLVWSIAELVEAERRKAVEEGLVKVREIEWLTHGHFCPVCTAEKCKGHFDGCQFKDLFPQPE